jgi:hypothetical protein
MIPISCRHLREQPQQPQRRRNACESTTSSTSTASSTSSGPLTRLGGSGPVSKRHRVMKSSPSTSGMVCPARLPGHFDELSVASDSLSTARKYVWTSARDNVPRDCRKKKMCHVNAGPTRDEVRELNHSLQGR